MNIFGKYTLTKSVNFDKYLEALGVNFFTKKVATTLTPTTEIKQNGDEYIITTSTTFKRTQIKFKLGEEFDETTADGRKCKSVVTLEGDNKLVHHHSFDGQQSTIVRDFQGNQMTMKLTFGEVECTRVYAKVRLALKSAMIANIVSLPSDLMNET